MQEKLRQKIISFREQHDDLSGTAFHWSYTPVPDFENKENYPLDFQIFMEEIGELDSGSGVERGDGHLFLSLESPVPLLSADELGFHYILDVPSDEWTYTLNYSKNQVEVSARDVVVIATDVDAANYGFATTEMPYKFFDLSGWREQPNSFFPWFKERMTAYIVNR